MREVSERVAIAGNPVSFADEQRVEIRGDTAQLAGIATAESFAAPLFHLMDFPFHPAQRGQHPAQQCGKRPNQYQHQPAKPAEQYAAEAPQLLLVRRGARSDTEGELHMTRAVLQRDATAFDLDALVSIRGKTEIADAS